MPRISGRQIAITIVMAVLAAAAYLPAGSPSFRPAWFTDRVLGIPISAWTMLALIVCYLILLRIISDAVFKEQSGDDEGASS